MVPVRSGHHRRRCPAVQAIGNGAVASRLLANMPLGRKSRGVDATLAPFRYLGIAYCSPAVFCDYSIIFPDTLSEYRYRGGRKFTLRAIRTRLTANRTKVRT